MSDSMARIGAETAAVLTILGRFVGILPAIATFLAILWYMINIYESGVVQNWLTKKRHAQVAQGKETVITTAAAAASAEARASLPDSVSPPAAALIGALAAAKARLDTTAELETKTPGG